MNKPFISSALKTLQTLETIALCNDDEFVPQFGVLWNELPLMVQGVAPFLLKAAVLWVGGCCASGAMYETRRLLQRAEMLGLENVDLVHRRESRYVSTMLERAQAGRLSLTMNQPLTPTLRFVEQFEVRRSCSSPT